jgi:hypothetical protein
MLPHYTPEKRRVRFTRGYLGPAGTWWLRPRFEPHVPVHRQAEIVSAAPGASGVVLRVREAGTEREMRTDHVVAGTGFEVDTDRLAFLAPDLRARIARIERAPRLDRAFPVLRPRAVFRGRPVHAELRPPVPLRGRHGVHRSATGAPSRANEGALGYGRPQPC